MILKHKMRIIYFLFIFIIPVFLVAQESENVQRRDFKRAAWHRAKEGIDYSDQGKKDKKDAQKNKKQQGAGASQKSYKFGGNASPVLKVLIIALLVVALFFLMRSLLGLNNPKNKAVKPILSVEELEQLEDNLHQADLEGFIQRALAQGNYALAIRLYYLAILKALSLQDLISWKKDKTNRDYLREMNRSQMATDFSNITAIFERIWYGNLDLQQQDFERVAPKFKTFIHEVENVSQKVNGVV